MTSKQDVIMAAHELLQAWNRNFQAMPDEVEDGLIELHKVYQKYAATCIEPVTDGEIIKTMPVARQAVLRTLRFHTNGLTDEHLYQLHQGTMTRGQVKSRRVELVQMGLCYKDKAPSGTKCTRNVWKAT